MHGFPGQPSALLSGVPPELPPPTATSPPVSENPGSSHTRSATLSAAKILSRHFVVGRMQIQSAESPRRADSRMDQEGPASTRCASPLRWLPTTLPFRTCEFLSATPSTAKSFSPVRSRYAAVVRPPPPFRTALNMGVDVNRDVSRILDWTRLSPGCSFRRRACANFPLLRRSTVVTTVAHCTEQPRIRCF